MNTVRRKRSVAVALLIVTAALWILAALFKLNVTPFFHAVLIRRIGMIPVLGFMLVAPLLAAVIGILDCRRSRPRGVGASVIVAGGLFLTLFLVVIAVPMLKNRLEAATPANPQTPRPVPAQTGLPVFPGAEGFGTRTPAGRGGGVLEVTTLADGGPGSLREAIEQQGPRIVVFRVGGTIELKDFLYINHPFITVDGSYHVSVHHCLLAHNDFRNPLISSGGTHDIVNNVIYDWGVLPAEVVDPNANTFLNFVGNYFRPGPSSRTDCFEILINPTRKYGVAKPKFFVQGNLGPHRSTSETSDWSLVGCGFSDREPAPEEFRAFDPFQVHCVSATDAEKAFEQVLAEAGATLPQRDAVDRRIVAEVRSGSGRIIDSPDDVGGYPQLASGASPVDTDHDGMPDEWESHQGLDLRNPADAAGDRDGDGYTNVEEYLHNVSRDTSAP
jgi:hypothetical protein